MRTLVVLASLAVASACAAVAQDTAQTGRSLGADSLFGPGVVGSSPTGQAVKLRLVRPAHVVAFALTAPAVVRMVLPRRPQTRSSRAGDQWIDLPSSVRMGDPTRTTFTVGRVYVVGGRAPPPPALPPSPPSPGPAPGAGQGAGVVTLVIVSDSAWTREGIVARLPTAPASDLMGLAQAIALALTAERTDTWAAYITSW